MMLEALPLTTTRIVTYQGDASLTNASGFFFSRDDKLFLVTSRHVMLDEKSDHVPDRIEIVLHTDEQNIASVVNYSIPLYQGENRLWCQAVDSAGDIDVAVIKLDPSALPDSFFYRAFTIDHLVSGDAQIDIGASLVIIGYPLGFHDSLHNMPVVRQGALASSFGYRFQGKGFFLTDARTHRGISGAPVVMRLAQENEELGDLQFALLGIHSARLDVGTRDVELDEALGLNCSWYADILLTLTE